MIRHYINKLMGFIGYTQTNLIKDKIDWAEFEAVDTYRDAMTEDELAYMLAEKLGIQDDIDSDYEKKIFADLKGTEGLVQYLREAAARDKDRYFGAGTKEEQLIIRGAFARTMYLKGKIMGSDSEDN